jgi:undecaprenyl-diphosphatase
VAPHPAPPGRRRGGRERLKQRLPLRHALLLGALQGATEPLPVSSSAHLALVPRLAGWPYAELDPAVRKSFEVALHAGSASALAVSMRRELRPRDLPALALTALPPALIALAFERSVERRLGGARSVAAGQIAGALAMWLADRSPELRRTPGVGDHLAVGLAQAAALMPGVSRAGVALTAVRALGLGRAPANALALRTALPVTAGAVALKGVRAARGGVPPELTPAFAVGTAAAFAGGRAGFPLALRLQGGRAVAALTVYRMALGVAALAAGRRRSGTGGTP